MGNSIRREVLHYRYHATRTDDDPMVTYAANLAELHAAVRQRGARGSIEPVMLREADIQPFAALFNPASIPQSVHMLLAAYASIGFAVAGVHAWALLRDNTNLFHQHALGLALIVGGIGAIFQPFSGDFLGKMVARTQPVKFATMEGQFATERRAPLRIGGW